jgi:hypothetical protein
MPAANNQQSESGFCATGRRVLPMATALRSYYHNGETPRSLGAAKGSVVVLTASRFERLPLR